MKKKLAMSGQKGLNIPFRGYTKKENGHYVSVCIDLNIAAQGSSAGEALKNCIELIVEYISYVQAEHPNRIGDYIPRLAPRELIEEFDAIVAHSLKPRKQPARASKNRMISSFLMRESGVEACVVPA